MACPGVILPWQWRWVTVKEWCDKWKDKGTRGELKMPDITEKRDEFWKNERTDFGPLTQKCLLSFRVGMLKLSTAGRLFAITLNSRINKGPENKRLGVYFPRERSIDFRKLPRPRILKSPVHTYIEHEFGKCLLWCAWKGTSTWNLLTAVEIGSLQRDSGIIKRERPHTPCCVGFLKMHVSCKVHVYSSALNFKIWLPVAIAHLFWDLM